MSGFGRADCYASVFHLACARPPLLPGLGAVPFIRWKGMPWPARSPNPPIPRLAIRSPNIRKALPPGVRFCMRCPRALRPWNTPRRARRTRQSNPNTPA